MELGFCGRDCGICDVREAYGCSGCRESGGVPPHGPCPVAACCRERGLEKCGDCQALDCAFLPEREGGPRAASRLAPLRREGLGGADRAAELGAGLRRLFWIWLGGDAAVYLAAGIASVLLAHGCTWVLRLIPGALELAVCLAMGRTLSRLGEAYRTVPPFLTAYGAVRAVSGAVSSLPVLAALTLLQGGLELVWIFRLYRANGALLERIGDRRAVLWRCLARWAVAVGAGICLMSVPVPSVEVWQTLQLWSWVDSLPTAVFVLAYALAMVLLAVKLCAAVLWVVRWVQLWRTAETFRRLGTEP